MAREVRFYANREDLNNLARELKTLGYRGVPIRFEPSQESCREFCVEETIVQNDRTHFYALVPGATIDQLVYEPASARIAEERGEPVPTWLGLSFFQSPVVLIITEAEMIHGHYYESSITCYMNRWIPSYNEAIKPVNSLFRKLKKWPFLFNLKTNKKCSWLMAPLTANAYSERNYAIVDGYEKFEVLWPEVKPRKPRQSKSPKAVKTKKSIPRRDPKMYYMRFFLLDGPPLSLDGITAALTARNASFSVKPLTSDSGNLFRDDELLGQLEVNLPGTDLADEELEEFRERVSKKGKGNKSRILAALDRVQAIVSLGILWQGRSTDDTLDMILPLWITLHKHGTGLLQADGEGFYDNTGDLIYEIR